MSFKTASAIIRGKWLLNKEWADAHFPFVVSFLKGDKHAAELLFENKLASKKRKAWSTREDDDDDEVDTDDPVLLQSTKNVYSVNPYTDLRELPNGAIAYVELDGPLLKDGDWCSFGMCDYAELIDAIAAADNIAGLIIDTDSPGGQVDGTATLADSVRNCGTKKPVIGFIDDGMSASASYWVISACGEVYVSQPTDMVGSVGVFCSIADWNAYYLSQGLPVHDVYAPQSEDKNLDYRQAIAGDDSLVKAELKVIADAFISAVKKNRKGKIKGEDWATGKMYFPADAISLGLIDGIKNFSQVVFRITRLISSQKNINSNTMAFEKTLKAAKAESFAVTDEGFAMQEEHLNNLEAAITEAENSTASLVTANGRITELENTVNQLNSTIEANAQEAANAAEQLQTSNATIATLQAEIAELGTKPSGTGTVIKTGAEPEPGASNNSGKPKWYVPDGSDDAAAKYGGQ